MGKDTALVNIYIKIHNKNVLTMDDLRYLAEYDPECFVKTCKNVVYNIPEAKPIMESSPTESSPIESSPIESVKNKPEPEFSDKQNIEKILESIKRLEKNDFPEINVDDETVKSLLGNLYMEMLFPHNDKYSFMDMSDDGNVSLFDKKA